jgi:cytoskeleton protein RodZ
MSRNVGQQLQQARQEQGFSLEQVAEATHIRLRYLQEIENGNLDSLPSYTQARGFLRVYADFLKLDPGVILDLLDGPETSEDSPSYSPYQAEPNESENPSEEEIASQELARKSENLMITLGERLRIQRETLGISLEDVERQTHLRIHYLRALEEGDLDSLPSPVQGRGMLKNYAEFLGMDTETLLLTFADSLQAQHAARQPERTRPRPPEKKPARQSPLRRIFSGDLILTAVIVLALVIFVGWGVFQIASARSAITPTPDAPSIADVLVPSSSPTTGVTETPSPPLAGGENGQPSSPTGSETLAAATQLVNLPEIDASQGTLQVYVSARQRAWMRVTVDGEVQFEGLVLIGTVYPFSGFEQIEVLTGNGGGLIVYYNEQNLGPLGSFGEVVNRIYTPAGVFTPTPTITPTLTDTPLVSPTPRATQMFDQP